MWRALLREVLEAPLSLRGFESISRWARAGEKCAGVGYASSLTWGERADVARVLSHGRDALVFLGGCSIVYGYFGILAIVVTS